DTPPVFHTVAGPGKEAATDVQEGFDKIKVGEMPPGWSQWSSAKDASFAVSDKKALSPANGLASIGGSTWSARAWPDKPVVADVQASAAVLLDSLIPVQVLARGSGLDGATPTFYAVQASRGMEVQLLRVVKGTPTELGTLRSAGYFSEKWVRLTL